MKKFITIILSAIFLISCSFEPSDELYPQNERSQSNVFIKFQHNYINNELLYYKDNRTSLCFAATCLNGEMAVLTNVPCTPEVEKIILKDNIAASLAKE